MMFRRRFRPTRFGATLGLTNETKEKTMKNGLVVLLLITNAIIVIFCTDSTIRINRLQKQFIEHLEMDNRDLELDNTFLESQYKLNNHFAECIATASQRIFELETAVFQSVDNTKTSQTGDRK